MGQRNTEKTEPSLRNIALKLSYVGTNYHGWQIQENALTVQEVFQKALYQILKERVDIKGCSRTDTGVHANMYIVNFRTSSLMKCENFILALNRHLPGDICVYDCAEKNHDFHARYSCKGKEYIYKIWNNKIRNPFFDGRALHYWYPLKIELMNEAAQNFVGKHDFSAFATLDTRKQENMERTVEYFKIEKDGDFVNFIVKADGFLYNMVRIMVGTLLRVSQGKIAPNDIEKIINSKSRKFAGPTAPPQGLYLNKIFY
ncbi:MAG: tRNA pseudouridine(38-40) synthase TruA [Clostridia bacterium]|nr:tRNA pseudouridine(38-40) synthase TruA [Clostridia bacterium]